MLKNRLNDNRHTKRILFELCQQAEEVLFTKESVQNNFDSDSTPTASENDENDTAEKADQAIPSHYNTSEPTDDPMMFTSATDPTDF